MAVFRPFQAIRPAEIYADQVAALPYDVMNTEEAREMVKGNPISFLHIDRAEIDLPEGTDPYSPEVYEKAARTLKEREADGTFIREDKPCYYIYALTMDGRSQAGIVGCASVDDYLRGTIKKHELTVEAKEQDRIHHVDALNANTGIIFLAFRSNESIEQLMDRVMESDSPLYDFVSEDGIRHQVWKISQDAMIAELEADFEKVPCLYIADGHHRAASAVKVGQMRRAAAGGNFTGDEEFNFFLAAAFPASQLAIWDYNRVVRDLNGYSREEFMRAVSEKFEIKDLAAGKENDYTDARPAKKHTFSMYLGGKWYALAAKPETYENADAVNQLDVSILQNEVLAPVLGIGDPRTDSRVAFVGGIRGMAELVKLVDSGEWTAAFALYPTSIDDLMQIADEGKIMPPKSTWFEPKLRSGLFIHEL